MKKTFTPTAVSVLLAAAFPLTTFAEQASDPSAEEQMEVMEVTGSHISRTDTEGPSPVASFDESFIENTGAVDLIGLFQRIPLAGAGTFSTQGNSSDDTSNGGSSVSLRGLGADSTLVLINGRRIAVAPFAKGIDTAFVDLNNIPLAAIKKVEILKDGASATYGSDAIAGVINIILKNDINGIAVNARTGSSVQGGGEENNASIVWGQSTESTSSTIIVDYFKRDHMTYGDRDFSSTSNQAAFGGSDQRSSAGAPGTVYYDTRTVDASSLTVAQRESYAISSCGDQITTGHGSTGNSSLCRYDYAPMMSALPGAERLGLMHLGSQKLTDNIEFYDELSYQNNISFVQGAASPAFNELFMSASNPNHPFADSPTHPLYNAPLSMRRRLVEIGDRQKEVETNQYRLLFGVKGYTESGYRWDTGYSEIRSQSVERGIQGFPNASNVQAAIDNGSWDPFSTDPLNQDLIDELSAYTSRVGESVMRTYDAKVSGELMSFDNGGYMAFAAGIEVRDEKISDNPDDNYLKGNVFGTENTQANARRNSNSAFVELGYMPMDELEVQFALRHESYSDFGDTTNPKIAFMYRPTDSIQLRGSWGTAFRAPSLHQLGLGATNESPNLVDNARCAQTGDSQDCDPREYTAWFSGNPDLEPEESTSINFGAIAEVTDDFSVGVDLWDYDMSNVIMSDTQNLLDNESSYPDAVVREAPLNGTLGQIVLINDSYQNFGGIKTNGVDVDVQYRQGVLGGEMALALVSSTTFSYEEENALGQTEEQAGGWQTPKQRWMLNSTYAREDWNLFGVITYIGSYDDDPDSGTGATVDAWTTVDLTFNYTGYENTKMSLGVNNLFDEEPPYVPSQFMGYDTATHNALGLVVFGSVGYQF